MFVPILVKITKLSDTTLCQMGIIFYMLSRISMGVSWSEWMLYVCKSSNDQSCFCGSLVFLFQVIGLFRGAFSLVVFFVEFSLVLRHICQVYLGLYFMVELASRLNVDIFGSFVCLAAVIGMPAVVVSPVVRSILSKEIEGNNQGKSLPHSMSTPFLNIGDFVTVVHSTGGLPY